LRALTERLRTAHQIDATAHVTDLRKPEDIARLVKDASDIDILVNNAGDIPAARSTRSTKRPGATPGS